MLARQPCVEDNGFPCDVNEYYNLQCHSLNTLNTCQHRLLETIHSAFTLHTIYYYTIQKFDDIPGILHIIWSVVSAMLESPL